MKPWKTIESVQTEDGLLELRRRGARDFMIMHDGRLLMGSMGHTTEVELASWGCGPIHTRTRPRVLTAGLGLGYTLRACLDILPSDAHVMVSELNPIIVEWCHGPVAVLTDHCVADPRVHLVVGDVMDAVRDAGAGRRNAFDAIVIDLYFGPAGTSEDDLEPVYGDDALASVWAALTPGGVYAVWGEEADPDFATRLMRAGFTATVIRARGSYRHVIYTGVKPS